MRRPVRWSTLHPEEPLVQTEDLGHAPVPGLEESTASSPAELRRADRDALVAPDLPARHPEGHRLSRRAAIEGRRFDRDVAFDPARARRPIRSATSTTRPWTMICDPETISLKSAGRRTVAASVERQPTASATRHKGARIAQCTAATAVSMTMPSGTAHGERCCSAARDFEHRARRTTARARIAEPLPDVMQIAPDPPTRIRRSVSIRTLRPPPPPV